MQDVGVELCLVCGGETTETRYGVSRFSECPRCGLARVRDYDGRLDYWDSKCIDDPYWSRARESYFRGALAALPPGRLLDIGGGVGEFAHVARSLGRDAYSLDTSQGATAAARRLIGEHAIMDAPAGVFDIATLWCVIAHVADPGGLLDSAVAALRPAGTLWLTTPNFAFQKRYARLLNTAGRPLVFGGGDDHLWQFTADSLTRLLRQHDFTDVRFTYRGVTEWCSSGRSSSRVLVGCKRGWNRAAITCHRAGLPLLTSDLQVLARRTCA